MTEQQIIKVLCEIAIHVGLCDSEPTIDNVIKGLHKANCKKCDELASELLALQGEKEEPAGSNFVRITELTDEEWLKHSKEEILQLYKNCHQMLMNYIGLSGEKTQDIRTYTSTDGEPTKDIPDDMIEKWAENNCHSRGLFSADYDIRLLIEGAKAMQSGEIARWAKENGT